MNNDSEYPVVLAGVNTCISIQVGERRRFEIEYRVRCSPAESRTSFSKRS